MGSTTSAKRPRRSAVLPASDHAGSAIPSVLATSTSMAVVMSVDAHGVPHISVSGGPAAPALVLHQVPLHHLTPGTQVLVTFVEGDVRRPVVIGAVSTTAAGRRRATTATVDGKRVELTGDEEVVLSCGKASITLTRAGKVIISGTYVSSRSGGVNRITGGSVQIN